MSQRTYLRRTGRDVERIRSIAKGEGCLLLLLVVQTQAFSFSVNSQVGLALNSNGAVLYYCRM
ncbi:unnamed protein product [Pylaiella littoralis]